MTSWQHKTQKNTTAFLHTCPRLHTQLQWMTKVQRKTSWVIVSICPQFSHRPRLRKTPSGVPLPRFRHHFDMNYFKTFSTSFLLAALFVTLSKGSTAPPLTLLVQSRNDTAVPPPEHLAIRKALETALRRLWPHQQWARASPIGLLIVHRRLRAEGRPQPMRWTKIPRSQHRVAARAKSQSQVQPRPASPLQRPGTMGKVGPRPKASHGAP